MKKYYIINNNKKEGTFTLEELKEKEISRNTLIWREGFDDWKKIEDVKELDLLIKEIPPEIPVEIKLKNKINSNLFYYLKRVVFASIVFLINLGLYNLAFSGIYKRYDHNSFGLIEDSTGSQKEHLFNFFYYEGLMDILKYLIILLFFTMIFSREIKSFFNWIKNNSKTIQN